MELYNLGEELGCPGSREEVKLEREEPDARGEPGSWPRTEAAVTGGHGCLS